MPMYRSSVNGCSIESNKGGNITIVNHLVTFGDGSRVDTRSKAVRFRGRGYIKVDGVRYDARSQPSVPASGLHAVLRRIRSWLSG